MSQQSAHTQQTLTVLVPVGVLALVMAFCLGLWIAGSRDVELGEGNVSVVEIGDKGEDLGQVSEEDTWSEDDAVQPITTGGDNDGPVDPESIQDSRIVFDKGRTSVDVPTDLLTKLVKTEYEGMVDTDFVPFGITSSKAYKFGTLSASANQTWNGRPIYELIYTYEEVGSITTTMYYTTQEDSNGGVISYTLFPQNTLVSTWGMLSQPSGRNGFPVKTISGVPIKMSRGVFTDLVTTSNETVIMTRSAGSEESQKQIVLIRLGVGGFLSEWPLQYRDGKWIASDWQEKPIGYIGETVTGGIYMAPKNGTKAPLGQAASGALYSLRPDGHVIFYDVQTPFWKPAVDDRFGVSLSGSSKPMITWTDKGPKDAAYYKGKLGGCGSGGLLNLVEPEKWAPYISPIGTASNGEKVYGFEYLIQMVNAMTEIDDLKADYDMWHAVNGDKGMKEFYALRPVFIYKDLFGRWVKFTHSDVVPSAECGKPVIYLYPPQTTDVTVHLSPKGGFSKVEPAYDNGWRVTAHPDGRLINSDDGKTYPYLFWEGRGGYYQAPDKYWVIPRKDVVSFLDTTLAKLGLNTKEAADFKEFWVPRMQSAPYYKVGFHGTAVMNDLAPLAIEGAKVDTLVRVLMDYAPLQKPEASRPPVIHTPKRNGFTVIEWGGVLR